MAPCASVRDISKATASSSGQPAFVLHRLLCVDLRSSRADRIFAPIKQTLRCLASSQSKGQTKRKSSRCDNSPE